MHWRDACSGGVAIVGARALTDANGAKTLLGNLSRNQISRDAVRAAVTARAKWYRANADLCRKMAARSVIGDRKADWLDLAQGWMWLSAAEERLDTAQSEIALGWLEPRRSTSTIGSWRRPFSV
jgi:hypothetical protein